MADRITTLIERVRKLEAELEKEFDQKRSDFRFRLERGRVEFESDLRRRHKAVKQKMWSYLAGARPLVILTAPVIYAVIIPFALLDIFITIYQAVCFPVYRLKKVKRGEYITFDRNQLSYLNGLEKLNCIYCSYGNGLLAYAVEIAARTEKHWCPIKHAKRMAGRHAYYHEFVEFGDAEAFQLIKQAPQDATK